MSFPRQRFAEAGATAAQLDSMQASFDALAGRLQHANADRWAEVAAGDLAEVIAAFQTDDSADADVTVDPAAIQPPEPAAAPVEDDDGQGE